MLWELSKDILKKDTYLGRKKKQLGKVTSLGTGSMAQV
jgi:hypothetical protein